MISAKINHHIGRDFESVESLDFSKIALQGISVAGFVLIINEFGLLVHR